MTLMTVSLSFLLLITKWDRREYRIIVTGVITVIVPDAADFNFPASALRSDTDVAVKIMSRRILMGIVLIATVVIGVTNVGVGQQVGADPYEVYQSLLNKVFPWPQEDFKTYPMMIVMRFAPSFHPECQIGLVAAAYRTETSPPSAQLGRLMRARFWRLFLRALNRPPQKGENRRIIRPPISNAPPTQRTERL